MLPLPNGGLRAKHMLLGNSVLVATLNDPLFDKLLEFPIGNGKPEMSQLRLINIVWDLDLVDPVGQHAIGCDNY